MAVQNFLSGGYYGKMGDTVGQRWHNKRIIRSYVIPSDPKTQLQQANRHAFGKATELAQIAFTLNIGVPAWDTTKSGEFALRVGVARRRLEQGMTDFNSIPVYPDNYVPSSVLILTSMLFSPVDGTLFLKYSDMSPLVGRTMYTRIGLINVNSNQRVYRTILVQPYNSGDEFLKIIVPAGYSVDDLTLLMVVSSDDSEHNGLSVYQAPSYLSNIIAPEVEGLEDVALFLNPFAVGWNVAPEVVGYQMLLTATYRYGTGHSGNDLIPVFPSLSEFSNNFNTSFSNTTFTGGNIGYTEGFPSSVSNVTSRVYGTFLNPKTSEEVIQMTAWDNVAGASSQVRSTNPWYLIPTTDKPFIVTGTPSGEDSVLWNCLNTPIRQEQTGLFVSVPHTGAYIYEYSDTVFAVDIPLENPFEYLDEVASMDIDFTDGTKVTDIQCSLSWEEEGDILSFYADNEGQIPTGKVIERVTVTDGTFTLGDVTIGIGVIYEA